jgi:outer membrane autotransporter protein
MEWLRHHRTVKNLSNQGITLKFLNPTFNQMLKALQLPTYINQSGELLRNDWAIWSEGSVTIGEVDATEISSMKDIKSTGITLGVDKRVDEHRMFGAALRISNYDVDVGSSGNNLNTKAYSLSLYGTAPYSDHTYIDGIVGFGKLKIDQIREHESGTLRGTRYGKQLFGSIVFSGEFERDEFTVSPYGRLDAGYTKLSSFTDSGTIAALTYEKQTLINGRISFGLLIDHTIRIEGVSLKPNGRFEYGKEVASSSDAVVSYLTIPGTKYTLKIDDEKSDNLRFGFGIDVETDEAWAFKADYEINKTINSGYTNTLNLSASYLLSSNIRYELSFVADGSPNAKIGLGVDFGLTSGWSFNASGAVAQTANSKYEATAQLRAHFPF